jgi:ElaB/YqjD/DUF883 family membrane-anchored ribosome-binding protein
MKRKSTETADAGQLMEDAQALLTATAHIAEEKVVAARNRVAAAIQNGREVLDDLKDKAIAGAKATDETIREHPYQSIGVALGVGVLLGYFLGRRN